MHYAVIMYIVSAFNRNCARVVYTINEVTAARIVHTVRAQPNADSTRGDYSTCTLRIPVVQFSSQRCTVQLACMVERSPAA